MMMPPHDTYIATHLGGRTVMRNKPPARNNIAIDIEPQPLEAFDCAYNLQKVNDCAHRYLPYLIETRTSKRRYRHEYSRQAELEKVPKAKLIAMILAQREDTRLRLEAKGRQITEPSEQLAKRQDEIAKEKAGQKVQGISKHVNPPSSKKREWDKDGNLKPAAKARPDSGRMVEDTPAGGEDHRIQKRNAIQVVRPMQENGCGNIRKGTAGLGHRPERHDRDG
jgi:hypothetical protein